MILFNSVSCATEDSGSEPKTTTSATTSVSSVSLNFSTLNLGVEDTAELTATVKGTNLSDTTVSWVSSDTSIATVSASSGESVTITAKADGSATIKAISNADSTVYSSCSVTVKTSLGDAETKFWRADEYDTVSTAWSSNTTLGIMTVCATSSSKATLAEKPATVGDYSFTKAFASGGGGSTTSNSLKFTMSNTGTITVYAAAAGTSNTRNLMLKVGDNTAESLGTTTTTATTYSYSYTGSDSVDCYLYSSNSGIDIYAVKLEVEGTGSTTTIVRPTGITLDKSMASLERTDDEPNPTVTLTATITNAEEVTSGYDTITWTSSDTSVATVSSGLVKAVGAGSTTITASTVNGKSASCEVTVTSSVSAKIISLTDSPVGYASVSGSYSTSGSSKTVTTRSELLSAISSGGIIIIDGMIDMSEGKLPAAGTTSMTSTTALDSFVSSTISAYSSYSDWIDKYTAVCTSTTEDGDSDSTTKSALYDDLWTLNAAYGALIKITLKSGTTLIGKDENCGIRGGSIQLSNVSNIQIRNLTLQDAVDPFPHHEVNSSGSSDGYNAQWDCITIQNTCSNIWIDHCTLEDTLKLAYTTNTTKEKWQIYDGLCDMKNSSTNISISNCIFKNHDKTMLIGSSDSDGDNSKRFVSLIGNYFYNCGQRLPMVRNTTIHILNNYYNADSTGLYSNSYAVGCRKNCIVYAENNYFGSGIQYSFKDSYGSLYSSGNTDYSSKGVNSTVTGTTLFSSAVNAYSYTAVTATEAKTNAEGNAGSGYLLK